MGQFSWLDCKTEEQVVDDKRRDVYVLIPRDFGGGHIKETCYDGYGNFGGHDIFDLVADWNREYLTKDFELPYSKTKLGDTEWAEFYFDYSNSRKEIEEKVCANSERNYFEYRYIGITLACYDEDNEALPFPIKITHDPNAIYEWCPPSKSDPNQGWECEEDDDDWEEEQYWTVEDEEAEGY